MIISSGEFRRPGGRQLSAYPCVGCEKVNCPTGAREAGLGHDSARRFAGEQGSALRGGFLSARTERNQRAAREWAQRDRTGCAAPAQMTMAPSSAPFGGTFPLVGGRLCGRPHGAALADISGASRNGRVLDPPLRRIWERPRCFRRGRSQTGPPGFASGALAGKPRRRSGTAPAAIFADPGPSGPAGI